MVFVFYFVLFCYGTSHMNIVNNCYCYAGVVEPALFNNIIDIVVIVRIIPIVIIMHWMSESRWVTHHCYKYDDNHLHIIGNVEFKIVIIITFIFIVIDLIIIIISSSFWSSSSSSSYDDNHLHIIVSTGEVELPCFTLNVARLWPVAARFPEHFLKILIFF